MIIGVDDETREVVGVDNDSAFQVMDSIANAVADSCVPQIVPNKELEMEGARISWDELSCIGYEASDEEIEKLCKDIMKYREEAGLPKRKVTSSQLINWKLLKKTETALLASNAFVLLVSDYFPFSKTQCAVFKGTERTVFLDKREFTGSVYEQIENATAFVLRNIRLGAAIEGLVRKEAYELPVEAIREMIINAHCHRNLTDASCVQVAVYDDRSEVTSPGGLYNGLTYEEIICGHSKLRNRVLANIFSQMGFVEAWGTGIRRIKEAAKSYGLPEPDILVFDDMFRVNLYRNPISEMQGEQNKASKDWRNIGETPEKHRRNTETDLNRTQRKILELLSANAQLSAAKLAKQIGVADRNVEANMKKLKERGILIRHGSPKSGYWEIIGK